MLLGYFFRPVNVSLRRADKMIRLSTHLPKIRRSVYQTEVGRRIASVAATLISAAVLIGCSSGAASREASDPGLSITAIADPNVLARLESIRHKRETDHFDPDFIFGPGDVLDISAQDVPELRQRQVRISPEGTIELPVVGTMKVAGLTESQFTAEFRHRLARFVKDPEVNVFVKQYFSRDVAVVGAVVKPGLYNLNSGSDTLLSVIDEAGGLNDRAPGTIVFIPAPAGPASDTNMSRLMPASVSGLDGFKPTQLSTTSVEQPLAIDGVSTSSRPIVPLSKPTSGNGMPLIPHLRTQEQPIVIDMMGPAAVAALAIPARPGDVLIVPASGSVMVQGWVRTPGAYPITPGMTVLGAVTAAGGQMFSSSATLLRGGSGGIKTETPLDLAAIESGKARDFAVQPGDVVLVHRSAVGAVPYFFYTLFGRFGTGIAANPSW
jgi:protein involved in polysaccharide export with SLBB domain